MNARKKRKSHDPAYAAGVPGIQLVEYNVVAKLLTLKAPDIPLDIPPLALESIVPDTMLAGMDVVLVIVRSVLWRMLTGRRRLS